MPDLSESEAITSITVTQKGNTFVVTLEDREGVMSKAVLPSAPEAVIKMILYASVAGRYILDSTE